MSDEELAEISPAPEQEATAAPESVETTPEEQSTKSFSQEVVQTIQDIKAQADAQIQASQQTVETESQPS